MAKQRNTGTAPRLTVPITKDQWQKAVRSSSGGCLIADAIKTQYPELQGVSVDMATVRATDPERGERYIWLTPGPAQMLLLGFDQGWDQAVDRVQLRDAVQITKVKRHGNVADAHGRRRAERKVDLEAREAAGEELSRRDRQALTRMRETDARHEANGTTTNTGPVVEVQDRPRGAATVVGGRPIPTGRKHPNLLAGRNRHYGAKLAKPGLAFEEAVEQRVAEHLAEMGAGDDGGATRPVAPAPDEA